MIIDAPINNLSLGNVSLNIIRELIKRDFPISAIFPVGENADFSSYDKLDPDIRTEIIDLAMNRLKNLKREDPTLRVWHLNQAERKLSDNQYLFSFYECDAPTIEEIRILQAQTHTFFSCSETVEIFKKAGVDNVSYVPLGFDPDFGRTNKEYLGKGVTHFGLIGKWEKRKNTERIIRTWLRLFGGKKEYQLTCLVDNPFFKPEIMQQLKMQACDGKHWNNINFLPRLKTNSEVNDLHNAIDIDLSGAAFGEGWGIPSFTSACLGNVCLVGNAMAHKDWAQGDNIVLIEPEFKESCIDNVFFHPNSAFNVGNFHNCSDETLEAGILKAYGVFKNSVDKYDRSDLIEKFSYKNTVDKILEVIYS
jgi:hypothetical protein